MKKVALASLTFLALIFILSISQTGCSKNDPITTDTLTKCTPTIEGLWTGSQVNAAGSGQDWSWSIRPDGTASYENTVHDTRQLAVGTWTIKNGTWTCNTECIYGYAPFVGIKQTYTANYDSTTGALTNGTFVTPSSTPDSGTFTLKEVNAGCKPFIEGLWKGAQVNAAGSGQDWSWSIRPDGSASYENTVHDTRQLAVGTWTIKNGTWTCNTECIYGYPAFVGIKQTYTAKYDSTTGALTNGAFITPSSTPDFGTFTLTVVQ